MNIFEKDYMLDTFVAMVITQYNLAQVFSDETPDFSLYMADMVKQLQKMGVTLDEIDKAIAKKDFTNMLTHVGSGDRERSFVMEYIEELWVR